MVKRSPAYWRAFVGHAHLQAVRSDSGKPVFMSDRGPYLMETAFKMIDAGLWHSVKVKGMNNKVWIPIEDVPWRKR